MFQIVEISAKKFRNQNPNSFVILLRIFFTYILVCFAWIFFRANSISDAEILLNKLTKIPGELSLFIKGIPSIGIKDAIRDLLLLKITLTGHAFTETAISWFYMGILFIVGLVTRKESGIEIIRRKNCFTRWILYILIFYSIMYAMTSSGQQSEFIYFQF